MQGAAKYALETEGDQFARLLSPKLTTRNSANVLSNKSSVNSREHLIQDNHIPFDSKPMIS